MIPAVHQRGRSVGRLLRYLFGPGRHREHTNPRLVAAWHGAGDPATLQPPLGPDGHHDVRRLAHLLEQPVHAAHQPPPRTVWHCSLRNHADDRVLSDQQWGHIAAEVMAAAGLAPHGDPDAVRWVAVRHDDDGIHLAATLVRQDGRTVDGWNDYRLTQAACRDLEKRYNLRQVAPPGHGTRRWPRPAEQNKTTRTGQRQTPRDQLRRHVRTAAATADSETDFFHQLRNAGLQVRLRHSSRNPDQITGYAVGLAHHRTSDGHLVWYSGGSLAPDLTLPKLRHRWHHHPGSAPTAAGGHTEALRHAASHLTDHARASGHDAAAIAQAAADVLTTTAHTSEGIHGGPLTHAAETLDRATRHRHHTPPPRHPHADQLRAAARMIALTGRATGDRRTTAVLRLLHQLASLAHHLADLHQSHQRLHRAREARHAAHQLRTLATPTSPSHPTAPWLQPTRPAPDPPTPTTPDRPRRRSAQS